MSSLNNLNLNKEDETKPIQDTLSDNIPLQIEWVSSWIISAQWHTIISIEGEAQNNAIFPIFPKRMTWTQ